jgi:hypothetical protein
MARIQKKSPKLNLSNFQTFVVDAKANSEYFRLSEVPDTLTSGKNGFLIEGSVYLKPSTEIKIEVLDTNGEPLFVQFGDGIPEYYEGLSKLISIHVYQDTPIGVGKITILGEAETYLDENGIIKPIPEEWSGIYNVKWEKEIKINKNLLNESKVRFIKRPQIIIEELGESFYSKTITKNIQNEGTANGIPVIPSVGTNLSNYAGSILYYVKNNNVPFQDGAVSISISGSQIQSASILDYINQYTLLINVPHTSSKNIVSEFRNLSYSLNYETSNTVESSLFGSFARFEINNLATFVGDVERIKLYGKSNAVSADYNLIYESRINSANLLETIVSGSIINRGLFTESVDYTTNWQSNWSSQSLSTTGLISLDTDNLYKSVKFRNFKVKSEIGNDILLEKGSEYTLEFYVYYNTPSQDFSSNTNDKLNIYVASAPRNTGLTSIYVLTSSLDIIKGENKWRTPTKVTYNFIPDYTDEWNINFEATNDDTLFGDTFWQVGNVKLYGSNELGYSPDEFGFTIPIQRQLEIETFDFKLEYYDINNNFVPIQNSATQTFVSGNLTLLGKNLSAEADKYFFTFDQDSKAIPDSQVINLFANKTRIAGNLLITSQAFDSGGVYIPPAAFLGYPYPGTLTSKYEDLYALSASLNVAEFTGSLHGIPPDTGDVIVDRMLYTFTEQQSTQPQIRRVSISRVLTNAGTGSIGAAGADSKVVNLTSNIYAIPYGSDGSEIGTNNIWLTASAQNHVGVVYYDFSKDGVTKQNTTSQYYNLLTADKPNTGSRNSWRVDTREGSNVGTIIAFDTIDLFGLKDGTSGYTVFLTNTATSFPSDENGNVSPTALSTGISDVIFYRGTSSFTYDQSSPYDVNSYRTGSITASANITYTLGVVDSYLRLTPTSITTNGGNDLTGSVIIPITDNNTNITFPLRYNYSISRRGATGASGSDARVVILNTDRYTFTYDGDGIRTPTAQTASLTASSQNVNDSYYEFLKNGITKQNSTSQYYIVTGSEIPTAGNKDSWKVNLRSGSTVSDIVAFDTLDIFGVKDGKQAKTVTLASPYYIISYNAAGNLIDPTATFVVTASAQNFTTPYFKFTGDVTIPEASYTAGSSSNGDTASFTPPSTYFSSPKQIRVGVAESTSPTTEVAFDTITIAAVKPGQAGTDGITGQFYYIRPVSGTQLKNSTGTLELQAVYVSGSTIFDLQSGSVVLATGSTANSVLQIGNGVTAGTNGVNFNAILNGAAISGSRIVYLKDTGSNKLWDSITLIDTTDGLSGGSALADTLVFIRNQNNQYTPSTSSLTASFFSANGVEYQERYRVYPYYEGGLDRMYFTLDTDSVPSNAITASVDIGGGTFIGIGFNNRAATKDLNFKFEFRDPQVNDTASFVETFYIVSDGVDGDDAYTVVLTNESHTIQAGSDGVVPVGNYGGSGTQIIAYRGTSSLNGITSGIPINGQFSASYTITGSISIGTITSPSDSIIVGDHSNFTSDSASITFIINCEGSQSIAKVQSITKAKEGNSAYTVFLTNEAHVFPADDQGNVSSANLTAGVFETRFLKGTQSYSYDQTSPFDLASYRTGSITSSNNITFNTSIVSNNLRFNPTSVNGTSQLSGSIVVPLIESGSNITFIKTYSFSISKAGTSGSNSLSILLNPTNQVVTRSKAGTYQSPTTFSIQVFETGSPLLYTGSNNTLQSGYFTIHTQSAAAMGTIIAATGSISASIIPPLVTSNSGTTSSFAIQYRDSKGTLSSFISQSHRVAVVTDGNDGINGASGSDSFAVDLISSKYTFTYDQNGNLSPLTSQTASLTASAQTGSGAKPWGANIFYEFVKNGTTKATSTSPFYIITGSEIPSIGAIDLWQVNLRSGSAQTIVAFDNIDLFGLKSGSDGYTVFLTNEAHTFAADDQGNISSANLTSGQTDLRFYRGSSQYTLDQIAPYDTNSYRTGSIVTSSNITISQTIVSNDLRITPTNVIGSGQLTGSITIPIIDNANNSSFTKIYTFSISKAGSSGSNALSILLNPSNQSVTRSKSGNFQSPVTFSIQVFETGSPLLYTGSNNTLQSGYFTIHTQSAAAMGTLIPATGSISASIIPPTVTTLVGTTSSFAVQYRDSKGTLSTFISQSHRVTVVSDGNDGINGASGSDAFAVDLISSRYTFTYDQNNNLTPLTAQTASLTASAQTGSGAKPWGANIFYEFVKNGSSKGISSSPFYIITGSEIPSIGAIDLWQVNLRSGSAQTIVAFDNIDIFGLKSGSDAYTVFLTNEAHTFAADEQGVVSSANLTSGLTDVRFYRGTAQYTFDQTIPYDSNSYRTGSIISSSNIVINQSIVSNDLRITPTSVVGTSQLTGSVTIPIIDNATSVTFNKVYTFSISKAGGSGSNAININLSPSTQTVTASLNLGTYSTASNFNVFVYETGSNLRYTTSQPPTTRGTFTIYMGVGNNGTNISTNNELSGTITPFTPNALRPFTSSFAVQYLDSKGNLSSYISQSHITNVVSIGQTGPGIVFTGPWSSSRVYQYDISSSLGRRDVVISGSSNRYYATLQQHTSNNSNKPTDGASNTFWQFLGEEDYFVAAKIAIFEESYVQNTLNIGTTNYEQGYSSANIIIAGGTPNPYIAIGQTVPNFTSSGIWIGNDGGTAKMSLSGSLGFLKWDGAKLYISGNISASEGRIGGITISSQSLFIGNGGYNDVSTSFFVSSSGDFSLKNSVVWNNSTSEFSINRGSISIGAGGSATTTINTTGKLFTENADVRGKITATDGSIGGWSITSDGKIEASQSLAKIIINANRPALEIYSGSESRLAVDVSGDPSLTRIQNTTLTPSSTTVSNQSKVGSSLNNTGGDISNQFTGITATYSSGSFTRLTSSFSTSFDISSSVENQPITIQGTYGYSSNQTASFFAKVDSPYYISTANFSMRYGVALYSASVNGGPADIFVDSSAKSSNGTLTYSVGNTELIGRIIPSGKFILSRALSRGTYHLVPFVDLININVGAEEESSGGECNAPAYGTFAYYGNCVGSQQEVYRYSGTCTGIGTQYNGFDVYLSYETGCP